MPVPPRTAPRTGKKARAKVKGVYSATASSLIKQGNAARSCSPRSAPGTACRSVPVDESDAKRMGRKEDEKEVDPRQPANGPRLRQPPIHRHHKGAYHACWLTSMARLMLATLGLKRVAARSMVSLINMLYTRTRRIFMTRTMAAWRTEQ